MEPQEEKSTTCHASLPSIFIPSAQTPHRATERILLFRITSTRLLTLIVVIYKLGRHDPAFYYKTGCGRVHISLVSLLVENNIKFYSISFTRGLDVFQKPMISVGNIVLTTKIKKRASKTRKLEITKMRM